MVKAMLFIPEKNRYIVFQKFNQNTPFAANFPSFRIFKTHLQSGVFAAGQNQQFTVSGIW